MSGKRADTPLQGDEGTGLDAAYDADRVRAERELDETMAGPQPSKSEPEDGAIPSTGVSADDTELKNPDDELAEPGSAATLRQKRK